MTMESGVESRHAPGVGELTPPGPGSAAGVAPGLSFTISGMNSERSAAAEDSGGKK